MKENVLQIQIDGRPDAFIPYSTAEACKVAKETVIYNRSVFFDQVEGGVLAIRCTTEITPPWWVPRHPNQDSPMGLVMVAIVGLIVLALHNVFKK